MPTATSSNTGPLELNAPEKLNDLHVLDGFDCGEESIDAYLHKRARSGQAQGHAVVYVVCEKNTRRVVGYYTLSNCVIAREQTPRSQWRNSPKEHAVTLLGRMGVCKSAQGQGLATALLKNAVVRAMNAAQIIGSSAMIVHPLNDQLIQFYREKAGFIQCPMLTPVTLMLPFK